MLLSCFIAAFVFKRWLSDAFVCALNLYFIGNSLCVSLFQRTMFCYVKSELIPSFRYFSSKN